MKLLIPIIFSVCSAFLFGGCDKNVEQNPDTAQEVSVNFPEQIQQELTDQILVNAECVYPDDCKTGTGVETVLGENMFWDKTDEIVNLLLGDKEIESEEIKDYGTQKERRYYTLDEEERLAVSTDGYLDYKKTEKYMYISNVLYYDDRFDDYNGDVYLQKTDHSFMTQDEAWMKVQELMGNLGVEVSDDYTCFVMDHADMEKEEATIIARAQEYGEKVPTKKEKWTEEDDCYYFKTRIMWNDYPVLPAFSGEGVDEENVTVIYDKNGLVALIINGYYPLEVQEEIRIQSPDAAIRKLQEFLQNIISDSFYEVQQISLCQKVMGIDAEAHTATIVPVWECKVLVKGGSPDDDGYVQKFYFDAKSLEQL